MAKVRALMSGAGSAPVLESLYATENGNYTPSQGVDGFDEVTVAVPPPVITTKNITNNGTYYAPSDGADGYSTVTVNVQSEVSMTHTTLFSGTSIVGANALSDDYTKYDFIEFEVATPTHTTDEGELILITANELQTIMNANKGYLLSSWSNRYTMLTINATTMTVSAQSDQVITRVIGHKIVVS